MIRAGVQGGGPRPPKLVLLSFLSRAAQQFVRHSHLQTMARILALKRTGKM
jgi:hypothetical protein